VARRGTAAPERANVLRAAVERLQSQVLARVAKAYLGVDLPPLMHPKQPKVARPPERKALQARARLEAARRLSMRKL
jgi:hypothetical protein